MTTSTAGSLPAPHPAGWSPERLRAECEVRFGRRGGPGGQHRNKVETAVRLTHRPTGVSAEANERRAQAENLRVALRRLRLRLALCVRCPWTGPTEPWQNRCRQGRLGVSPQHQDFPGLLAEALDGLAHHDWHISAAAAGLGCTPSQLVRFLARQREALEQLNEQRVGRGIKRLRAPGA